MTPLVTPPFTAASALEQLRRIETARNSGDPERIAPTLDEQAIWHDRAQRLTGRDAILAFLQHKWRCELHSRCHMQLWTFGADRLALRVECEWQSATTGQWYRSRGAELLEFTADGRIQYLENRANDMPIDTGERRLLPTQDSDRRHSS